MHGIHAFILAIALIFAFGPAAADDPTRPPTAAEIRAWLGEAGTETSDTDWRLQSILTSPQRRLAIINGQRLKAGDRVDSAEVISIEPDHVVLAHRGREIILSLGHRRSSPVQPD
ncbi:MAG: hypothetical protein EA419_06450 [Wenzhouxiangella sp.]|nr:MAG: hypothetical protein EA419_06450 [Wenzhouxiangella sp.]